MTRQRITLVPAGVIPRDPALRIRMTPASVQSPTTAATVSGEAVTPPPPSCSLNYDSFDGTGDLSTHTLNTGGAWTAPEVSFQDGAVSNVGTNPGLESAVLADGQFKFDTTIAGRVLVLKPPTQPTQGNYFAEVEFSSDPEVVYIEGIIALRAADTTANQMSWIGIRWAFPGVGVTCTIVEDDGAGGSSESALREFPLAGGYQTIKIRCAVENSTLTTTINDTVIDRTDFSNVLYDIVGEIVIALNFIDDGVGGTMFEAPVLSFCSGELSEPT